MMVVYAGLFIPPLFSLFLLIGGFLMMQARGLAMAWITSVVALLPCTSCCILTLPIGIWAMVVLSRDEVKRGFA